MDYYEELELIGKGTYGKVFKVRSRADGEIYVVKKVQFDGTPQTEAEAALREGQVLSLLRHPHIVPYKEFFKPPDGDLCLVMAFCEGGDLFRHIRQLRREGRTVPEPQVWQWLVQLLLSLSYIHSKRILHRDVKTQNIFLSEGKVLLGDFGLAKQLQRTFEMARTPIGTPYYMAPEIYEEQPYSFKSDVWALGCVMYEMMTGKAAFAADNLSRVVLRVIRGQYDPLPESYSSSLRTVVTSMLCKEVAARPDANTLLTVPAVVPHVQSYLESLTAEGPAGWATWRMKLPLAAMVQMSEALEAAGVPLDGRSSQTPSNRPSTSGGGGAAGGDDAEQQQHQPAAAPPLPPRPSSTGKATEALEQQAAAAAPLPPFLERPLSAPRTPEPRAVSPPTLGAANGGGATPSGRSSQVVRLPPLPGAKLPPLRTPYGLATPFMGGVLQQPPQHYAELQVLANQMFAIRTSQCGNSGGIAACPPPVLTRPDSACRGGGGALASPRASSRPSSAGLGARPASGGGGGGAAMRSDSAGRGPRPLSGGGGGGAVVATRPDSAGRGGGGGLLSPRASGTAAALAAVGSPLGRPGSGGAPSAAGALTLAPGPAAAGAVQEPGGGGQHVPEEVRALDRTLIKTLEIARKAAEADGGKGGGGGIDEAALSAALPQGGFGFGGGGGGFGGGGVVVVHAASTPAPAPLERRDSSCSDLTLPPIQPRRPPSAGSAKLTAWASMHESSSQQPQQQQHALHGPRPQHAQHDGAHHHHGRPSHSQAAMVGAAHTTHVAWPVTPGHPTTTAGDGGGGGDCGAVVVHAAAVVHDGRTSYEEVDAGYVSISGVTLHAASLSARRANLQRHCAEQLGPALFGEVMQAVAAAQRSARGPGDDVEGAAAALRRQLDALLLPGPGGAELRQSLGPLVEELALLHL